MIRIAVVGASARGTIMLDRLCANADLIAPGRPVEIHVVEPHTAGAGRVWATDQDRDLLMNTVAGDVTVFADDTVRTTGPIRPGPTQYQWARLVASGQIAGEDDVTVAEARTLEPWSYASRAFQGAYLRWAFNHLLSTTGPHVSVHVHRARAIDLHDAPDRRQRLRLDAAPQQLDVDAVILAQGHFSVAPTPTEQRLADFAARHRLVYLPCASPAETDLSVIRPGEPVILRGLGLNFFDYVTLLTSGRGGRFVRDGGSLRYVPSGTEPMMYAGSRRGVPHLARAELRQEVVPRYQPRFFTAEVIAGLRTHAGTGALDFLADVWPYVARETEWVYYQHLLARSPALLRRFQTGYPRLEWGARTDALIAELVPDPGERWNWETLDRPATGRTFTDSRHFQRWVRERLEDDGLQSRLGPAGSAFKATTAMLRDLRDEIRQVISHRGIGGDSYRRHIDHWFSGLINSVASGPPSARVEELRALLDAGVVTFVGPGMTVTAHQDSGVFTCASPAVPGSGRQARVLIEAHLPLTDIRRTDDPLLRRLLDRGDCRAHTIPNPDGTHYETTGLDVTEGAQQIVDAEGRPHPGRFSYGPPVEAVQWVTAIGARPYVNSRTLLQADAIARAALTTARTLEEGDAGARLAAPLPTP
ncbi:FAD/NAD(P)-binding protein [Spirillospora sp. CA-253888]